jgi:hypothetical protein
MERREFLYSTIVEFLLCKAVSTIDRVKLLAHELTKAGLHPSPAMGGEQLYVAPSIDALVEERYTEVDPDIPGHGGLCRSIAFPLVPDDLPVGTTRFTCGWMVFKGERVKVSIRGGIWAYREERRTAQEPIAEKLLALALKLYPMLQPTFGSIDVSDFDGYNWEDSHIVKRKIITLNWVNFFGPEYVATYGREMLANIPGYRTQDLPDGGLLYQARPSFVIENELAHKRWQGEAAAYMAAHNIKLHFGR